MTIKLTHSIYDGFAIGEPSCGPFKEINSVRIVIGFSNGVEIIVISIICKWISKDEHCWSLLRNIRPVYQQQNPYIRYKNTTYNQLYEVHPSFFFSEIFSSNFWDVSLWWYIASFMVNFRWYLGAYT